MAASADVVIVGGGVIGLTAAWFLAEQGTRVTLLDRGDLGQQASWAGAGIIPPGNPFTARTPFDRLRALSADLFPTLTRTLIDRTGIDNGYCCCGGLELPEPGELLPIELWEEEGIYFTQLDGPGLRKHEPGLAPSLTNGYHLPTLAQIRNPRHLRALIAMCEAMGVCLRPNCPVDRLLLADRRVTGVGVGAESILAGRVLIAAGAWADELLAPLGIRLGVRPIRGQIALLNPGRQNKPFVVLHGRCYLVRRGDGRVLVGSTEEDVGFDARTTASSIGVLLRFATSLSPELASAEVERCWAGLRPGSPDGLPFLGPVPRIENLFVSAGHFRAGLQLSPATGLLMTALLLGREPPIPVHDFRLDRPLSAPVQSVFRS